MSRHIIKYRYDDGVKLTNPILWCGRKSKHEWMFENADHAALSVEGSVQPCKNCIKAIIKQLEKEL
jgi:hypothetical protein